MISYSPSAAKAIGYLKRPFNEVEIFVEDTACKIVWQNIIRKLLPRGTKVRSLNHLGGRENVLAACRLDQVEDGRRKLYIIDSDFDYAHGRAKPKLKFLYRLRAYCLENLLVVKDAVEQIAEISDPAKDSAAVRAALNFDVWRQSVIRSLHPLYVGYAVASKHHMILKTVAYPISNFIESVSGRAVISDKKISRRLRAIWRDMSRAGTLDSIKAIRRVVERNLSSVPGEMYISGKDGILPLLLIHLRATVNYRGTMDQLKAHLASLFTKECEPYLARRLAQL